MDSLKGLIDSRDYELVIKLTENSKNGSDLFYRIAAFTCLGKYEEALKVIKQDAGKKWNTALVQEFITLTDLV